MQWRLCTVGRPSLPFAQDGAAEYLDRIARLTRVQWLQAKEAGPEENAAQLLKLSRDSTRVALDERGAALTTSQWVETVDRWELDGVKTVSLLVGGADGHTPELRRECDAVWSLSPLTLQHEVALVVLLESLYRVYTIKRGMPYHRA